jgi:hypothetical protein
MRKAGPVVAFLVLAACATTEPGHLPERHTTAVSMAGGDGTSVTVLLRTAADGASHTARLGATADEVWNAVARAYADLEIPVETMDPATRRLGNTSFVRSRQLVGRPLSSFVQCGYDATGAPVADSHRIQMSLLSEVVGRGSETELTVHLRATALPGPASTGRIHCRSSGQLEQRLANAVALNLVD